MNKEMVKHEKAARGEREGEKEIQISQFGVGDQAEELDNEETQIFSSGSF